MNKDLLDNLFEGLQNQFDTEEPVSGHRERFLNKLQQQKAPASHGSKSLYKWLRPWGIAASIALLFGIGWGLLNHQEVVESGVVSSEVEEAQYYFASVIEQQMEQIQKEATPETQLLVEDAMIQMKKLEENYNQLEKDLENTGNTELILNAMITNFQTRINLLQDVMENIKQVKELKKENNNENTIT